MKHYRNLQPQGGQNMKHLVIDKRVIRNNIRAVKEKADGAAIYADLSANAYGMGLWEVAQLLRDEGIRNFAVSDPRDAALLRNNGFTDENIMMLHRRSGRACRAYRPWRYLRRRLLRCCCCLKRHCPVKKHRCRGADKDRHRSWSLRLFSHRA